MSRIGRQLAFLTGHPLTQDRPLSAVGRFVSWQIRSRLQQDNEIRWIGESKLLVRRGMTGATGNIYCGLHEFVDMAFLLHLLRPDDLFGDIGANVGSYTVLASAVCGAKVVAVEPDPGTVVSLRRNILLNRIDAAVQVAETAVGDQEGSIRFTVGRDTMNKVSTEAADESSQLVPLTTLDRLFERASPIMLKLDVEGFEGPVLQGAKQLLANKSLKAVQSESRDSDVLELLLSHGFIEQHYDPFTRQLSGEASFPQSNGLFIRNVADVRARLQSARRFAVLHHEI